MRRTFVVPLLVVLASCAAHAQTARGTSVEAARRDVLAVIDRLAEAGIRRDVKAIERLYAEGYFHTNADGSVMTKAQVLESYRAPSDVRVETNRHDEDRVQVFGETAVVNSRVVYKGLAGGEPFSRLYRVTYVLRKRGGAWQLVASHASLLTS